MAMDVPTIMSEVASLIAGALTIRVYDYPPDTLAVPAAVVAFPESIEYDLTMDRGKDRLTVPVHVIVGKVSDRSATKTIAGYLNSSGVGSFKAVIESDVTLNGSVDSTRVTEATVSIMVINQVEYLAATFTLDIVA